MEKALILRTRGAQVPRKGTERSAAYDLQALGDDKTPEGQAIVIQPGEYRKLFSGIRLALPDGTVGLVRPRSSTFSRRLLIDGVWDEDFRGEFMIAVVNLGHNPATIEYGERLAQLIVFHRVEIDFEEIDELPASARGEGGFGHTGRHYPSSS